MFQSIEYSKLLDYDEKTMLYSYEYKLTDSDFGCVAVAVGLAAVVAVEVGAIIREYSKRNLNVAANLVKFFLFSQKKYGYSIADQIDWAERKQPLFTPQIKADLNKYLLLL